MSIIEPKIIWGECSCHLLKHAMRIIMYPDDDKMIYIDMCLKNESFFVRLKNVLRYLFGKRSLETFAEIIINKKEYERV